MTKLFNRAKDKIKRKILRHNMTAAEQLLWDKIRRRQIGGYKFRRQYSVAGFVLDFYCPELKLAIEVDGGYHDKYEQKIYDNERQKLLENGNIMFLRFTNEDIFEYMEFVLKKIEQTLQPLSPPFAKAQGTPSPLLRGKGSGVRGVVILLLCWSFLWAAPSPYQSHNSYLGETVDTQTGALVLSSTDVALAGRNGMGISVVRSYNSKHYKTEHSLAGFDGEPWDWRRSDKWGPVFPKQWSGYMGRGWQLGVGGQLFVVYFDFGCDTKLVKADPVLIKKVFIQLPGGTSYQFDYDLKGNMMRPTDPRIQARLEKTADGFILYDASGLKYYFTKKMYQKKLAGYEVQVNGKHGRETALTKDGDCSGYLLEKIVNNYKDYIEIEYDYKIKYNYSQRGSSGDLENSGDRVLFYAEAKPLKIKNSLGNEVRLEYNKNNQVETLKLAGGLEYRYVYDNNGQLSEAINPRGEKTKYTYKKNVWGLIDSIRSPLGAVSSYKYFWQDLGSEELNNYTVLNKELTIESSSYAWKYEYKGGHTYDVGNGRQFCFAETAITDPRQIKTTHYYRNGYPVKEYLPNQVITEYVWDEKNGHKLQEITVKGNRRYITEYKNYDEYGNPEMIINWGDPTTNKDDKEMHNEYLHKTGQDNGDNYRSLGVNDIKEKFLVKQVVHSWVQRPGADNDRHNEVYFRYDEFGNFVRKEVVVIDQKNNNTIIATNYAYNDHGELVQKVLPNGAEINYTYIYGGSSYTLRELSDAGAMYTEKTYESRFGNLLHEVDHLGQGGDYSYDRYGMLIEKKDLKTNLRETYDYQLLSNGAKYTKTDALGNQEITTLDSAGRKIRTDVYLNGSPKTRTTTYEYGEMPTEVAATLDFAGRRSELKYDAMSRPVIQRNFDGTFTETRYYDCDNKKEVYDVKGQKITYFYDAYGNLIKTLQPNEAVTEYEYDIYGKLAKLTTNTSQDFKKNKKSEIAYTYDSINRLTEIVKGTAKTVLEYDKLDNVIRKYLPAENGELPQEIDYSYDQLGRLVQVEYRQRNKPVVSEKYTYYADPDNRGRLKSVEDENGTTTYEYDRYGNTAVVEREMFGQTKKTYYSYNKYGELESVQYPGLSTKLLYTYDDCHRLSEINYQKNLLQKQKILNYEYTQDIYERVDRLTYGNGVVTAYEYDAHDRVNKIESTNHSGDRIFRHEYTYDALGNRNNFTYAIGNNPVRSAQYEYNTQYQLTRVKYDDDTVFLYKYDDNGNRTYFQHRFGWTNYVYDYHDRLAYTYEGEYKNLYSYDQRGNLIRKQRTFHNEDLVQNTEYEFDLKDQLRTITELGAKQGEYDYDYRGMRVRSKLYRLANQAEPYALLPTPTLNVAEQLYWYGGGSEVLTDTDASGNVTAIYMMAGGKKIAGITPASTSGLTPQPPLHSLQNGEGELRYYHTDVLGSVVAVTDERGKLVEGNVYGPFGEIEFSYKGGVDPKNDKYGLSTNRYMYTGQEQDAPGGLMYYGARWYDSETGRFISEDPATATVTDPLSINRYIYCRNNPLIYTDPTGALFTEMLSFLGPLGTFFGGLIDAYLINKVVEVAVVAISNDMAKNGNISGAKALMTGYQIFTVYQLVTSVCDLFSGISKTGDGQDLLKNNEELKRRGVGLDGVKFDVNGGNVSMIDIAAKNEEFARKMGNQVGWAYEWGASREGAVDCIGGVRYALKEMGYNIPAMKVHPFMDTFTIPASGPSTGTLSFYDWLDHEETLGVMDHVVTNLSANEFIHASFQNKVTMKTGPWLNMESNINIMDTRQIDWNKLEGYK